MSDEASAELLTPKRKKAFKDNSQVIRVFDSDGYRLRSDALCFKDENKREVLLVSSRNTPDEWTIPGGGLDPGEQPSQTAVREAMEEAGVQTEVLEFVGVYDPCSPGLGVVKYNSTLHMEVVCPVASYPGSPPCTIISRERAWNDARKTRTYVFSLIVCGDAPNWKDNKEIQRTRQWTNTKAAIAGLEQRERHIKSKYLKAAYELPIVTTGNASNSSILSAGDGYTTCNGLEVGKDTRTNEDPT